MIYKSAPAWSLKPKSRQHTQPPTPSPLAYHPKVGSTLTKSPSWKIGRELRAKEQREKSPSPSSYHPSSPGKNNQMGVIGKDSRMKQNVNPGPGPASYTIESIKDSPFISFAKKYEVIDKMACFPGPGNYNIPAKKDKRSAAIGKQQRFTAQNGSTKLQPGPGNYQFPRPSTSTIKFTKAPRMSHQVITNNTLVSAGQCEITRQFDKSAQKSRGYTLGKKHLFSSQNQSPGPADYSPIRKDLESSPSISFSRKYREKKAARSPSPNQYKPQYKTIISKAQCYSIAKAERLPLYGDSQIPGPGAYLKTQYTTTGAEISLGMSRKNEEKEDFPGPGAYNPNKDAIWKRPSTAKLGRSLRFCKIKTETSNTSFYESRVEFCSPKYSFSKKKKLDEKYQQVPGPGAYVTTSSLCNLSAYALKH